VPFSLYFFYLEEYFFYLPVVLATSFYLNSFIKNFCKGTQIEDLNTISQLLFQ